MPKNTALNDTAHIDVDSVIRFHSKRRWDKVMLPRKLPGLRALQRLRRLPSVTYAQHSSSRVTRNAEEVVGG